MRVRTLLTAAAFAFSLMAEDVTAKAKALVTEKKYDEAIKLLEGAYAKSKTGEIKAALAETHVANGNAFMYNDALPPFQKYPNALRQFRAALKYDPENKKAKTNIATIEGIYKQMGRPIPQ